MQFQFDVIPQTQPAPAPPPGQSDGNVELLLRQMMEMQRDALGKILQVQFDHLTLARNLAHDNINRYRTLLGRYQKDMPELPDNCKLVYPVLERVYIQMIGAMTQEVADQDKETFENEFAIQDFIDRYGMRLGQLGHIVHVVGSLAEAANQNEAAAQAAAQAQANQGNQGTQGTENA
jgi:hypothetical protein